MVDDSLERNDKNAVVSKGKCSRTDILSPDKAINQAYLSKLNPSEVKIMVGTSSDEKHRKDSAKNWLQNTSIFKLNSHHMLKSTESSDETILSDETATHNERILTEVNQGVQKVNLPTPKSYAVTIDSAGKIHMAKPAYSSNVIDARRIHPAENSNEEKTMAPSNNCVKEVKPIDGENPAPYTVIINHDGMLDTIKTESNMKIPVSLFIDVDFDFII